MQFESLDPKVVGQRLTEARKARGVTQENAAEHLGCSRPTLIAIEKGTRSPQPAEIVALASLYGRKVHEIVRSGEPVADLQPHLRAVAREMNPTGDCVCRSSSMSLVAVSGRIRSSIPAICESIAAPSAMNDRNA